MHQVIGRRNLMAYTRLLPTQWVMNWTLVQCRNLKTAEFVMKCDKVNEYGTTLEIWATKTVDSQYWRRKRTRGRPQILQVNAQRLKLIWFPNFVLHQQYGSMGKSLDAKNGGWELEKSDHRKERLLDHAGSINDKTTHLCLDTLKQICDGSILSRSVRWELKLSQCRAARTLGIFEVRLPWFIQSYGFGVDVFMFSYEPGIIR